MRRTLLASLLTLAAGPALAQAPAPQLDPVTTIARIDTNHDGKITLEELTAWRTAHPPK